MSLCDEILDKKDITETLNKKNSYHVEPAQPFALPKLGKFKRVNYDKDEEVRFYKTSFQRNIVRKIFDETNNMFLIEYDKKNGLPKDIIELITHMEASGFLETDTIITHHGRSKLLLKMSDNYKKARLNKDKPVETTRPIDRVIEKVVLEVSKTNSEEHIKLRILKNGKISLKEEALEEYNMTDKRVKFKSFYERFRRHKSKERD